jgi:hypothetical protein
MHPMNNPSGSPFTPVLIAPCGINCGICRAYLREKNPCPGCRNLQHELPKSIAACRMRLCEKREGLFCFSCREFPCEPLKRLDTRYRRRYDMSEIENLRVIRERGMETFLDEERERWCSDAGILCVHTRTYYPARGGGERESGGRHRS